MFGWLKKRLLIRALRKLLEGKEMAFLKGIIKSKKLGAAIAGIATIILTQVVGLDPDLVEKIVTIVVGYLVAQGGVDLALALKGAKKE